MEDGRIARIETTSAGEVRQAVANRTANELGTASPADGAPALPWLCAGLIDLQVNGYAGIDFNGDPPDTGSIEVLADTLLGLGVTSFLPTLITASEERLLARLEAIAAARCRSPRLARMIPCVHVEGPFVAPEDGPRGAHPRADVRAPDLDEVDRWQRACDGLVGLVTLSPHWPGSEAFIEALVARGVRVAIGHTGADPGRIAAAAAAGATLSTHLGNGVAATLPRHPNLLWSQLADDRLTATFIADGHHLPADTLRAMLRAKGPGRRLLVSDTVALGGLAPGRHEQPVGGGVELSEAGMLSLAGTPYLAGAALPLHVGVATACTDGALGLAEALAMATSGPGGLVGGRGRLEVGEPADLLLFDHAPGERALRVRETWLGGDRVVPGKARA